MMRILSERFEVNYLSFQTLFIDKKTIRGIKRAGVKVIGLKELDSFDRRDACPTSFDKKLQNFFKNKYEIILFDSIYTAKYYLPFIYMYSLESKLIMDARHTQYLLELNYAEKYTGKDKKIKILEKSRLTGEKETPIYNYFDRIIVENKNQYDNIKNEVPNISAVIIPGNTGKNINPRDMIREFADIRKRVPTIDNCRKELEIKKLGLLDSKSIIEEYNSGIRARGKKYILMLPDNTVVPENFTTRLIFCMESRPDNGIVFPISNGTVLITTNNTVPPPEEKYDFEEFLKKHFIGNFAQWRYLNAVTEPSFLIKSKIIDQVGLLDAGFKTLNYALIDLCYRIRQAGYRIIVNQEAFIYYREQKKYSDGDYMTDQRILVDKWGIMGGEFLNSLVDKKKV